MTEVENKILDDRQLACDLIEIGVTHAASALIKEYMEAVDDDVLTLQKVRTLSHKLNTILGAFDAAQDEVDSVKRYIAKNENEANKQAVTDGTNHDNHE